MKMINKKYMKMKMKMMMHQN